MPSRFTRLHSDDRVLLQPQNSRPVNTHRELWIDKLTTYRGKRRASDQIVDVCVPSRAKRYLPLLRVSKHFQPWLRVITVSHLADMQKCQIGQYTPLFPPIKNLPSHYIECISRRFNNFPRCLLRKVPSSSTCHA